MDVMWYEVFTEERRAIERHLPAGLSCGFTDRTVQASGDAAPPARLISIRTQSIVPPAWAGQLAGLLSRSAGFDHLQAFMRASGRPIPAGYLPEYCARAVAEQALLLILALARRLPRQTRQFRTFHRDDLTGMECAGKTLLVVGVGHIGSHVAALGAGIGMRVLGVDLEERVPGLKYVGLDEGLRAANVIVCALPLTEATRGLLHATRLRQAQPGTLLVNIARGEIAPAADLRRLLDEGVLGGLGLDVYEDEPALASHLRGEQPGVSPAAAALLALADDERVICTPHNAFNTSEALDRKARQSCDAVAHFLARGRFPHPIPSDHVD